MDYDDNDFHSQNFHLAGEGSSKFPPVLRPYTVPKFDFDESLPGHLRFDSLAETEGFLGIESNEDNQWIDAYSRGSSGIEFSSTVAESCSISRHTNVWSEATSLESVEMLLKSVGQEEFIPREAVIPESDACDELACLGKQMEPNQNSDEKNVFKDNVTELQPPSGIIENLSRAKENVEMKQSLPGVSQGHKDESSIDGSSNILNLPDIHRNTNLSESSGTLFADGKHDDDTNHRKIETLDDGSLGVKTIDDSAASGVKTNITAASTQNISSSCEVLNIQNVQNQVAGMGDKEQSSLRKQTNTQDLESSVINKDSDVGTKIHMEEALESGNVVEGLENGINSLGKSLNIIHSGISNLQKADRGNLDTCLRNLPQGNASNDATSIEDDHSSQNTSDMAKIVVKDDSISERDKVEVSNSDSRTSPNYQLNVVTDEKTLCESSASKEKELLNIGDQMDTEILFSKSEASMFDVVDKNISTVSGGNSDSRGSSFFSFNTVVSTNPCIFSETTQVCENAESDNQGDHKKLCQDISVIVQESEKHPFDLSPIHYEVDHSHLVDGGVCSPSIDAGTMETKLTTSTISTPVNNSGHCEIQRMKLVGSASVDEKEDSEAKIAEEVDVPLPVGSSEQEVDHCPATETEKQKNSDTNRQLSCETASSRLQNLGTIATAKIGEPQQTLSDNKIDQECTKEVGVTATLCKSIGKQGDEVTVSFIKDDKAMEEHHDKPCSKLSGSISSSLPDSHNELHETGGFPANPTDNTCGPSVTSGSPPEGEKDENQVKPSAQLNPTISEFMNTDAKNTLSSDQDHEGNAVSKEERSSAPEVSPAANSFNKDETVLTTPGTNDGERDPFPVSATNKESMVVEKSPLASGLGTPKANVAGHVSHGSPQISIGDSAFHGDSAHNVSKGTPERKTKRAYNKTVGKESSRKGSKGKTPARQSEKGGRSTNVPVSPPPRFQLVQSNEVQQYGKIDSISEKPFSLLNASTSSLPDLNTSASPPVLFQQPFMDIQQVQLRAQILVYGAFIQGTVPDEAHMISAFGGPDGGRSSWEKVWSSCIERHRGQKSHPVNPETPLQSRSGPRTPDLTAKQSALQGKGVPSPLGLASSKATPTVANPLIPLSSPLWSIPTPYRDSLQSSAFARGSTLDYSQPLTSLHPYQTPPLRNFLGHNTSWISQGHPRGPGVASSTPAFDNSSHHSASPVTDTIKSTSVKGSSVPSSSSLKNVQPALPASNTGLQSVFVATTLIDTNIVAASHAQHSSDQKPKKRKKITVSEDLGQNAVHLQYPLLSTPVVSSHISTAVATSTPAGNVPITTFEKSVAFVSPLSLADRLKGDWNVEKMIVSDESLRKIEEARVSAEEASVHSAAAVNHSMEIWKQLDKQKNSGLVSDIEAKLASAAVAVAAAAAVAKAAAAAANVAANAALQAKLMADEALAFSGHESSCRVSLSEGMSNFGKATPASILKGANETNGSGSVIGAAKEAARRRLEAASADRKRAENLDAIVKAAELAAEAVSQAGKIVTMGDPLPLSVLVEAGPEGCWKTVQESSQLKGTRGLMNVGNVGDGPETSQICNISSEEIGKQIAASEESPIHKVHNGKSVDHMRSIDGISPIINMDENNPYGSKGHKVSDSVNPIDVLPESGNETQASLTIGNGSGYLEENNIKEGSLVEVFKDGEGFKAGWFTANILSLNDDKAYVCYSVLVADEGAGPLKEWVSVEGEGVKPPRIRAARPLTGLHNEGTKKRRREIMVDYTWSIGDRVDAWIQESWQEGVITDKNKKDKTFTVHFPVSGETSVVGAWHLRPSLIWKDGKWIVSPNVGANDSPTKEGDTPHEKRPKLGNPAGGLIKGKVTISKGTDAVGFANPGESRLLDLAENDKVFNIGKNSKNENKTEAHRLVRSGLQKEGAKVIFGVPKPGKKRKFMEVSKHYVAAGTSKINDGSDSVKLANFLIPSGSRGWTNSSRKDTNEKLGVDFKPTTKSGRLQSVSGRAVPPKGKTLTNSRTNNSTSRTERIKDSSNHFNNASESENQMERSSCSDTTGARAGPTDSHPTNKPSTTRVSKGKIAPAGGRLGKVEGEKALNVNPEKSASEANEPRRSNRRIQPTSRLLEGLQSSLIISKIPSGAHEKGNKNQNRNNSRGNNHG